jgi:hypothetical protein
MSWFKGRKILTGNHGVSIEKWGSFLQLLPSTHSGKTMEPPPKKKWWIIGLLTAYQSANKAHGQHGQHGQHGLLCASK